MTTKLRRVLATFLSLAMLSSMAANSAFASDGDSGNPDTPDVSTEQVSPSASEPEDTGNIFSDIGFSLKNQETEEPAIGMTPLGKRVVDSETYDELFGFGTMKSIMGGMRCDGASELKTIPIDLFTNNNGIEKSAALPEGAFFHVVKTATGDFSGSGSNNGVAALYLDGYDLMMKVINPLSENYDAQPIVVCKNWVTSVPEYLQPFFEAKNYCWNGDLSDALSLAVTNTAQVVSGDFNADGVDDLAVAFAPISLVDLTDEMFLDKETADRSMKWKYMSVNENPSSEVQAEYRIICGAVTLKTYYANSIRWERGEDAVGWRTDNTWGNAQPIETTSYTYCDYPDEDACVRKEEGTVSRAPNMISLAAGPLTPGEKQADRDYLYLTAGYFAVDTASSFAGRFLQRGASSPVNYTFGNSMLYVLNPTGTSDNGMEELLAYDTQLARAGVTVDYICGDDRKSLDRQGMTPYVLVGGIVEWPEYMNYDQENHCRSTLKILRWNEYVDDATGSQRYDFIESQENHSAIAISQEVSVHLAYHHDKGATCFPLMAVASVASGYARDTDYQGFIGGDFCTGVRRSTCIAVDRLIYHFVTNCISRRGEVARTTHDAINEGLIAGSEVNVRHHYTDLGWLYNASTGKTYNNSLDVQSEETIFMQGYTGINSESVDGVLPDLVQSSGAEGSALYQIVTDIITDPNSNSISSASSLSVFEGSFAGYALFEMESDSDKFVYEGFETAISDPCVLAVLASPPGFQDLATLDGGSSIANSSTSFGKSSTTGESGGASATVSQGFYMSYEFDLQAPFTSIPLASIETEAEFTASLTAGYSTSKEITYSTTYFVYGGEDSVVLYCIPYDVFYYRVYPAGTQESYVFSYRVPRAPVNQTLTLSQYNEIAKRYGGMHPITLNHTPGYPETYTNMDGYGEPLFTSQVSNGSDYYAVGRGGTAIEASVAESTSSEISASAAVGFSYKVGAGAGGFKAGVTGGLEASFDYVHITTSETAYAGCVQSLPKGTPADYDFSWQLRIYEMKSTSPNGGQMTYPLVTYHLKDVKSPPIRPSDFHVSDTSETSVTLAWNVEDARDNVEYVLTRNSGHESIAIANIRGTSYVDTGLESNVDYTYTIQAYIPQANGKRLTSITSDPISAFTHKKMTVTASAYSENTRALVNDCMTAKMGDTVNMLVSHDNQQNSTLLFQWEKLDTQTGKWNPVSVSVDDNGCFTFDALRADQFGTYRCAVERTSGKLTETVCSNEITLRFDGKIRLPLTMNVTSCYQDSVIYGNEQMSFNLFLGDNLITIDESDILNLSLVLNGKPLGFSITVPEAKEQPMTLQIGGETTMQTLPVDALSYGARACFLQVPAELTGVLQFIAAVAPASNNFYSISTVASCFVNYFTAGSDIQAPKQPLELTFAAKGGSLTVNAAKMENGNFSLAYGATLRICAVPNDGYGIPSYTNDGMTAAYYVNAAGEKVYAEDKGDGIFCFTGLTEETVDVIAIHVLFEKSAVECLLDARSDDANSGFQLAGGVAGGAIVSAAANEQTPIADIYPADAPALLLSIAPKDGCKITSWSCEELGTGRKTDLLANALPAEDSNRLEVSFPIYASCKSNFVVRAEAIALGESSTTTTPATTTSTTPITTTSVTTTSETTTPATTTPETTTPATTTPETTTPATTTPATTTPETTTPATTTPETTTPVTTTPETTTPATTTPETTTPATTTPETTTPATTTPETTTPATTTPATTTPETTTPATTTPETTTPATTTQETTTPATTTPATTTPETTTPETTTPQPPTPSPTTPATTTPETRTPETTTPETPTPATTTPETTTPATTTPATTTPATTTPETTTPATTTPETTTPATTTQETTTPATTTPETTNPATTTPETTTPATTTQETTTPATTTPATTTPETTTPATTTPETTTPATTTPETTTPATTTPETTTPATTTPETTTPATTTPVTTTPITTTPITTTSGTTTESGTTEVLFGDVSMDGVVDANDATITLVHYVQMLADAGKPVLTDRQQKIADVTGDGLVKANDATCILQYYVSKLTGAIPSWYEITKNENAPR